MTKSQFRLTAVWFTCPAHYSELELSVASVIVHHPDVFCMAVIRRDDPEPELPIATYRSDFDRGRHLSGTKASIGVIRSLSHIAKENRGTILKIDSDMIATAPIVEDQSGVIFMRPNGFPVGLYAMPWEVATSMPEIIHPQEKIGTMPKENVAVCRYAAARGVPVKHISGLLPDCVRCVPYSRVLTPRPKHGSLECSGILRTDR